MREQITCHGVHIGNTPAHRRMQAPPSDAASVRHIAQAAASLSFFSGRTLPLTLAGLAANHCSSFVNGLVPLRLGLAGTFTDVIFSKPGNVKKPTPFLLTGSTPFLRTVESSQRPKSSKVAR